VLSGYNGANAADVHTVTQQRMFPRIKPLRLTFTTNVTGAGGGTFTVEAFDATAAAQMCITGTIACTDAVGGVTSADCAATGTASAAPASDVRLRVNATGCNAAGTPLGTASLEYSSTLADEGVDFSPRFVPNGLFGLDGGGNFFGLESYQFDTVTCAWESAGVVSGGTDIMRVQLIQKSDAGVVCTCDLPGTCADAPNTEHTCTCSGGKKFIGTYVEPGRVINTGYSIQLNTATNCALNPRDFACGIPFRK
jgi:hypothetical protein